MKVYEFAKIYTNEHQFLLVHYSRKTKAKIVNKVQLFYHSRRNLVFVGWWIVTKAKAWSEYQMQIDTDYIVLICYDEYSKLKGNK